MSGQNPTPAPRAASSNVDMLRLEYPSTAVEIYADCGPSQPSVEIRHPAAWVRLLVTQQRQAQWDLEQLYTACRMAFDRGDRRIQQIEQNYTLLAGALEHVYNAAQNDTVVASEWMQTELIRAAGAAQKFTSDVWAAIIQRDQEKANEDLNHDTRVLHLKDAIQFLQVASQQRLEEQALWNANCEKWAQDQQDATAKLAAQQQTLQAHVSALVRSAANAQKAQPTYLQSAVPPPVPRATGSIISLPGATPLLPLPAATGRQGPPPPRPPRRRPRPISRSPAPSPSLPPSPIGPPLPPSSGRGYSPLPQDRRTPGLGTARLYQFMLEELRDIVTHTVQATQGVLQPAPNANVAKLKLKDPKPFDGKPTTPFTSWWESVVEFISFYPDSTDAQRIAWIRTLLSGTALDWHQHRRRTMGDRDTWALYATHLQAEYRDPQEGANAQRRLGELEYKGDIKAYLTEFRALNIYARCTGESLQEKINLAMLRAMIDMRFAHHMGDFVDDEHFLTATYEAGVHVEQQKALEELRGRKKEAGQKDAPGKDSGKGRKGQGEKEGSKRSERTDSGGKTERLGFGQPGHWKTKEEALAGVPTKERKEYGSSKDNCWWCGQAGHKTFECYAGTTMGGTTLPTAPWRGASSTKRKWDGDENAEILAPKQSKVTTIKTEDDDMRDVAAAWAKDQITVWDNDDEDSDF